MTNFGNQTLAINYYDQVNSNEVDTINQGIIQTGIYSGGYLTGVSDVSVSLSLLTCIIGDGTYQVRVQTTTVITPFTVSTSTPWVVLRWSYVASANNWMQVVAVAAGSILSTDLIVGQCVFAGSTLTGFNYSLRTSPMTSTVMLRVEPTDGVASMYLHVRAGRVNYGASNLIIVDQLTPLFTAPLSGSRIDLVQVNTSGVVIVTQGVAGGSPVAPNYGNLLTLAEVTLASGQTSITSTSINDVRGQNLVNMASLQAYIASQVPTFGTPSACSTNTVYAAATSGFVNAFMTLGTGGENGQVVGYTDGANPPVTMWGQMGNNMLANNWYNSMMFPVTKGNYWRVVTIGSMQQITVFWTPFGT